MQEFDPKTFVERQAREIRRIIGDEKALIAVSGGVDSTTCAVLTHMAIGENLLCVILDDAFMRHGEPERVAKLLSSHPLNLPMRIVNVQERFLNALKGLRDAEEKRKVFREVFYKSLSEIALKEGSRYLVQGTILADIQETKGGIKTQHNVLEQIGINTTELYGFRVVEPLVSLYKGDVRKVARYLKIPPEISERQPFPGPGLLVRIVGGVRPDKLTSLKKATMVTEEELAKHKPDQFFAAIIDNARIPQHRAVKSIEEKASQILKASSGNVSAKIFEDRATGVKGNARVYGKILGLTCKEDGGEIYQPPIKDLNRLQEEIIAENPSISRVLYTIAEGEEKPYVIAIRAVKTQNFLTAQVANIPWSTLNHAAQRILQSCPDISCVYYDVTPKPPATIEME